MRPLAVTLILAFCAFAGEVKRPTGPLRFDTPEDLAPHPSKSKSYNELWTFVFQFDGGAQLFLNFTRANLGPRDPVCGADAVLTGFQGKSFAVAREYPLKNFRFDAATHGLAVHENIHFAGVGTDSLNVFFKTSKQGLNWFADLKVTDADKGAVWGDGFFGMGEDRVGLFLHIPKAKVQGRIAINGDTLNVTGTAYMDHTVQTAFAPRLVRKGLRFVQHQGDVLVGQVFESVHDFQHQALGYGLCGGGDQRELLMPEAFKVTTTGRALKIKVPTQIQLLKGGQVAFTFDRQQDRQSASTLQEFNYFTKIAIKTMLGGEVFAFRGVGQVNGKPGAAYNLVVIED